MPTNRRYIRRPQRSPLSAAMEMELWLGPGPDGSAFESDEHRRAAWFRYRDRLMQRWANNGKRPLGWWMYEASEKGLHWPGPAHQASVLYEAGELSETERAELERWWREQFDRLWRPDFIYCTGPGKIFSGDRARVLFLRWADVPPVLVNRWLDEYEARDRVIRAPEEPAPAPTEAAAEGEGEGEPGAAA